MALAVCTQIIRNIQHMHISTRIAELLGIEIDSIDKP